MPVQDGFALLQLVIERKHSPPFVFFTSEDIPKHTLLRFDYPVSVVRKPNNQKLLNLVSDLLGVPLEKKGPL